MAVPSGGGKGAKIKGSEMPLGPEGWYLFFKKNPNPLCSK